jgi:hypothetical protein
MALAIKKYSLFLPCPPEHPSLLHLVNIRLIDQCFVEILLMPMHMGMGETSWFNIEETTFSICHQLADLKD